jgi:hypothetical protein
MPGLRHRRPEGNEESVPSAYPVREFLCEMLRLRLSMTVGWQTMLSMQLDRVLLSQRRRICAQVIGLCVCTDRNLEAGLFTLLVLRLPKGSV